MSGAADPVLEVFTEFGVITETRAVGGSLRYVRQVQLPSSKIFIRLDALL